MHCHGGRWYFQPQTKFVSFEIICLEKTFFFQTWQVFFPTCFQSDEGDRHTPLSKTNHVWWVVVCGLSTVYKTAAVFLTSQCIMILHQIITKLTRFKLALLFLMSDLSHKSCLFFGVCFYHWYILWVSVLRHQQQKQAIATAALHLPGNGGGRNSSQSLVLGSLLFESRTFGR